MKSLSMVVLIMFIFNPYLMSAFKQAEELKERKNAEKEIEATYVKISEEFGRLNIKGVLTYFSDGDEMVKISNGNVLRGKKELEENWKKGLKDVKKLSIEIRNIEYHHINKECVWTVADEFISHSGKTYHAVVSNIFILEEGIWKILQDHTTYIKELK